MQSQDRKRRVLPSKWRLPVVVAIALVLLPLVPLLIVTYFAYASVLQMVIWTCWCTRGVNVLLVYSDSPIWHDYIEQHILPCLGDRFLGASSSPAAIAGYPNITVPAGHVFGLPVGVSFFAGAWQEPTLIRIAYAFEQATQVRQPPQFLQTADLRSNA